MVSKIYKQEQDKIYYMLNRHKFIQNRRIDRQFQKISKELDYIMGYGYMLETLRYIKKTYYRYI
jgi:hypothetical protein